jgi:hypothetical protein
VQKQKDNELRAEYYGNIDKEEIRANTESVS